MPRFYLLRHGIPEESGTDPPLSEAGALHMRREAVGIARLGLTFDLILSSPLNRARQTARIVASELGLEGAVKVCDEALPGCRLSSLARVIEALGEDPGSVLLVGHQPDMGRFASELAQAAGPFRFERGTLACFECGGWPPAPPCTLVFLLPAEALAEIE